MLQANRLRKAGCDIGLRQRSFLRLGRAHSNEAGRDQTDGHKCADDRIDVSQGSPLASMRPAYPANSADEYIQA